MPDGRRARETFGLHTPLTAPDRMPRGNLSPTHSVYSIVPAQSRSGMARRAVAILLAIALAVLALAGGVARSATSDGLAERLGQLLARPELKGAEVGVRVVDLSSGRELFAHNVDKPLIPASNMKLLTTAAVLGLLGEEFRYETAVGMLGADLAVVGDGDPTIGARLSEGDPTRHFRDWARRLRAQGVRSVPGDLLLDDSLFDRQYVHPAWPREQLHRDYAAPVGALSLSENCVRVVVHAGTKVGTPARLSLSPHTDVVRLQGTISTIASRSQHVWSAFRRPGDDRISCSGRFWVKAGPAATLVTIENPSLYFGRILARVFREEGIAIRGRIRTAAGLDRDRLHPRVVRETPLVPLLAVANKESQNFYAEQLFKTLGAERYGVGSWSTGAQAVFDFLQWRRLPTEGLVVDDGSGLSRNNRLTAWHVTELLRMMAESPYRKIFRDSFAVAGVDGTLERRLTDARYRGRIHAKTGSLRGVRALSGYAEASDGRQLAFSLLVNRPRRSVRRLQDDFCRALVDRPLP